MDRSRSGIDNKQFQGNSKWNNDTLSRQIGINITTSNIPQPSTKTSTRSMFLSQYWKKLSSRVDQNHYQPGNIKLKAMVALTPLRDGVHMKFHEVKDFRKLKSFEKPADSNPQIGFRRQEKGSEFSIVNRPEIDVYSIQSPEFKESSDDQILMWATHSKERSLALQYFSQECDAECFKRFIGLIVKHISILIKDRYGSYLVQKIIARDQKKAINAIGDYCVSTFEALAKNEYSSRVLQRMIELSEEFRHYAMSIFKNHLELYAKDAASFYLITTGILHSVNEEERDILSEYIRDKSKRWYESKVIKKLILVYLDVCSKEKIDFYFEWLNLRENLLLFLQDKHSCNLLLKFLERQHSLARSLVLSSLKKNLIETVKPKFFGYFIAEILKFCHPSEELAEEIDLSLRSIGQETYKKLLHETIAYQVYCGAISIISLSKLGS